MLVEEQHQKIGLIGGPDEVFTARQRMLGYSLDHTVDKHNGFTCFLKFIQMGSCHIYRHIDNSIHTFPGKEIHCFFFKLLICSAVTDNRCISREYPATACWWIM